MVLVGAAILLVAAIGVFALTRDHADRSFSVADVKSAFASAGLPLEHAVVQSSEAVLAPADGSFNVLVVDSDSKAKKYYEPYAATPSSDTFSFQLLAGNVIVESDASNSDKPLAKTVRGRIRLAVARLARIASRN